MNAIFVSGSSRKNFGNVSESCPGQISFLLVKISSVLLT
jgi:hypothetical protein